MVGMIHQKEVDIVRSPVGIEEGLPEDKDAAVLSRRPVEGRRGGDGGIRTLGTRFTSTTV